MARRKNGQGNGEQFLSRDVPRALDAWFEQALERDPEASANELVVTLMRGGLRPRYDYDTVLELLVKALPELRGGLCQASAAATARLLYEHLRLDAISVVSRDTVLAFVGMGEDHHLVGACESTAVTQPALEKGQVVRTQDRAVIGCRREDCSLSSALVAPLIQRGEVVGALKLYHGAGRLIIERDEQVASGLARVFSVYLELAGLDAYAELVTRAQLEALRAQISPHFLFNALTTIAALTRVDADRAHGLILDFAEFFREALSERRELLRLRDELQNVERYLRFEQARFGDRLTVEYDIDPKTLDVLVPVLALQPLVENALTHGIAPKGGRGRVQISAQPLDGGCRIAIADDGVGIPPAIAERILERGNGSNLGVALNNVHHRLLGLFGTASGLQVESEVQRGTTVRFWLPPASAKKEGSR